MTVAITSLSQVSFSQTLWQKANSENWQETDKAIKYLDTLISIAPSDSAYLFRATSRANAGDSAGALADYTMALSLTKKDSARILAFRGQLEAFFDYNLAVRDIDLSVKINPTLYGYSLLAEALSAMKRYDLAIKYSTKQIEAKIPISNQSYLPYSQRGIAKYYLHDFKEALIDLDTAIYYSYYCPWCYKYRVKINIESGLIDEACKDYGMIKELYSEDTEIRILMTKYCKK
jgi:tetratricopeptide (TPR) repeat protein